MEAITRPALYQDVITFVNDNPVPDEGVLLTQGDLIKIGAVTYQIPGIPYS